MEDWTTTENYRNFRKNVKKYGMSKRQWRIREAFFKKRGFYP